MCQAIIALKIVNICDTIVTVNKNFVLFILFLVYVYNMHK